MDLYFYKNVSLNLKHKGGNRVKGLNIFQMREKPTHLLTSRKAKEWDDKIYRGKIGKTHNPYEFLMLALPCNFSNLFIAFMVFAIKSLLLGAGTDGDDGDDDDDGYCCYDYEMMMPVTVTAYGKALVRNAIVNTRFTWFYVLSANC